jgi:hypothetical protein
VQLSKCSVESRQPGAHAELLTFKRTLNKEKHTMNGPEDTTNTNSQDQATIDGYVVPVDPMDDLQCDSCQ